MVTEFTIQDRIEEYTIEIGGTIVEYNLLLIDSGASGQVDTKTLKVSANDTSDNYLSTKLTADTGINLDIVNPGLVEQLNIGISSLGSIEYIDFDTTATPTSQEARMFWSATSGTLEIGMLGSDVNLQVGQEILLRARNNTGSTILNGTPVYISGALGSQTLVDVADAALPSMSRKTLAIATEDILNNERGYFTTFGVVRDLDTSGFVEGDDIYVGIGGGLTNVEPPLPNGIVKVGTCVYSHATNGTIFVHIDSVSMKDIYVDTGDFTIYTDVNKTVVLDTPVYKDINIGGLSLGKGASAPDLITINATSILTYAFDGGATTEALHGSFELQHDYLEGTDIRPHIHWTPTTTGSGNVKWFLDYYIASPLSGEMGATTIVSGTFSVVDSADGTAWDITAVGFGDITGTNLKIGSQVFFRLYRDPTDVEDTYTGDAAIATVGVHYQIDTIGSRQMFIK